MVFHMYLRIDLAQIHARSHVVSIILLKLIVRNPNLYQAKIRTTETGPWSSFQDRIRPPTLCRHLLQSLDLRHQSC